MSTRSPKAAPARCSPYPKRQRTKSSKSALAESTLLSTLSKPKREKRRKQRPQTENPPYPAPALHSPLFNGINPVYLVRSMRAIARGNYSYAHGYLHLCILQARHAAGQGGVSAAVVFLLMLYSDNWLRLGIPTRAIISMEDALIAQEQMGEETEDDRTQAALAGLELREFMRSEVPLS